MKRTIYIGIAVLFAMLLLACGGQTPAPVTEATAVPETPVYEPIEDIIAMPTETPEPTLVPTPTPTPAPTPTPTPTPSPTPEPTPELLTNARLDSGAFDSYFDDAVFVGDSLTLILSHYVRDVRNGKGNEGFMGGAKFMAATSMSVRRASDNNVREGLVNFTFRGKEVSLTDGINRTGAKKVFLLFGLNDLAIRDWNDVLGYFAKVIDFIKADCPDVQIVMQAVLPVRKTFYDKQPPWNDFNIGLKALCEEKSVPFLDFTEELMDENGYLRADLCGDGKCHLTIEGENIWIRALRRYAASEMLGNIIFETP